ncbi:GNAT family N-acetyltransferase [Nocardia sp. NPDC127526]|uniref:GNAT family N-acetyltransferase n=1 Tax=Nocardia sp. NPDC127526 TaxID=3345393 RepID=UPI0036424231
MSSPVIIERATPADAETLSEVAAITFPLACPPETTPEDTAEFIANVLSPQRFTEYLTDPTRTVLKAVAEDKLIGYALLNAFAPTDPDVIAALGAELDNLIEVSKVYVLPDHHGGGVSAQLMTAALDAARAGGATGAWLGVNQKNVRAQRFYAKQGFTVAGTKTFLVGAQLHNDYVMLLKF